MSEHCCCYCYDDKDSVAHCLEAELLQRKDSEEEEKPRAELVAACGKVSEAEAFARGLVSDTEDIFSEGNLRAENRPKKMETELYRLRMEIVASGQQHDKALEKVQNYVEQIQKLTLDIAEAAEPSESHVRRKKPMVALNTAAYRENPASSCRAKLSTTTSLPKGKIGRRRLERGGGAVGRLEEKDRIQELEEEQVRVRAALEEAGVPVLEGRDLSDAVAQVIGRAQQAQANASEAIDMALAMRRADKEGQRFRKEREKLMSNIPGSPREHHW